MLIYSNHHSSTSNNQFGTLYVVATPIGNLEDITLRALRILKEVDAIATEDTRHTKKLLTHYNINSTLISYYREKEASKSQQIINLLLNGQNVALVSDAGVPCISDPGYVLVKAAHENSINVVTIPGPSAFVSAISLSGLNSDNFLFLGFLPSRNNQRLSYLQSFKMNNCLLIFYESPRRILKCLNDCYQVFGNRMACVCKELTKVYEHSYRGKILDIIEQFNQMPVIKGEYVVLLDGNKNIIPEYEDLNELLVWYRDSSGLSMKESVKKVSADIGVGRTKVYQEALTIWGKS